MDKRKLCRINFKNQTNILEIGCATGNIAQAFVKILNIQYTGIDIDKKAIRYASNSFKKNKNFKFIHTDLRNLKIKNGKKYDYILFAGIIHHIDDALTIKLLNAAVLLLTPDGVLAIVEPLKPERRDPLFIHYFMKLEQGLNVRTKKETLILIQKASKLRVNNSKVRYINATPFNFPICAKFGIYGCSNAKYVFAKPAKIII